MDWKKIGVQFAATFVAGLIFFPLLDWALVTFMTKGTFELNIVSYLAEAFTFALLFTIIDSIFERIRGAR